ncbi:hypothetical protein JXE04_01210 [Patescibacteria group bacterium]|nr:hypothetical protein [Patescibacteria group bacterium]
MKVKNNFSDLAYIIGGLISVIGAIILILSVIFEQLICSSSQYLDYFVWIGSLLFMLPVFMLQLIVPLGMIIKEDVPMHIRIVLYVILYLLIFPFANFWIILTVDKMFHFLLNINEIIHKCDAELIRWLVHSKISNIMIIIYLVMNGAGLLLSIIFTKKIRTSQ